jgi:hypothetical protein
MKWGSEVKRVMKQKHMMQQPGKYGKKQLRSSISVGLVLWLGSSPFGPFRWAPCAPWSDVKLSDTCSFTEIPDGVQILTL